MKYLVEICAYGALDSKFFIVSTNRIDESELKYLLDKRTKYGVKIAPTANSQYHKGIPVMNVAQALKYVKKVKLYKCEVRDVYEEKEIVEEMIEFHMSECFYITDIGRSYKFVDEGITFFYVQCDADDIIFDDRKFKRELGLSVSTTDAYYKRGTWRFFRNKQDRTLWHMVKTTKIKVKTGREKYIEEL